MFTASVNSYAKINTGLRVIRKRDDGFHDLETIFYPVKLRDQISIEIQRSENDHNSVIIKSDRPFIPLSKDNLCYKAVEQFFREFRVKENYNIILSIKKNIPVGGGLGGGSSNAAAVIRFLINFMNIDIASNREKILNIALSIGSDVPFFLMLKPCYAGSRGERMVFLKEYRINYDILIVNPNLHISTRWAFEKLNYRKGFSKPYVLKDITKFEPGIFKLLENDFEEVVFRKYSELKDIKSELIDLGAEFSSMSGTGATMYGMFDKNKKASLKKCRDYYDEKKYFTFISE